MLSRCSSRKLLPIVPPPLLRSRAAFGWPLTCGTRSSASSILHRRVLATFHLKPGRGSSQYLQGRSFLPCEKYTWPVISNMTNTQTRAHSGHSHSQEKDTSYLTSTNKNDAGVRITRIGLYVNLAMAIGKGIGGYAFHSQALSADAVHSLTDLVADFMTLAAISFALKPPTQKFPLGYGKFESLGSLGVSAVLLVGGFLMGWSAVVDLCQLYAPTVAEFLQYIGVFAQDCGHTHSVPKMEAAWLAGISVLTKEWLYQRTMKVAKERKSAVLEANAIHHRVDSLTGIAALVSIAVSNIFPSFAGMDALGGLLISGMVIRAGSENIMGSLVELADGSISDDMKRKVRGAASQALQDSTILGELRNVQGIKAGQSYLLELEIGVQRNEKLEKLTQTEDLIRKRIGEKVRGARRVRVRFVSNTTDSAIDFMDEFISPNASPRSSPEPEDENDHHQSNGTKNGSLGKKGN